MYHPCPSPTLISDNAPPPLYCIVLQRHLPQVSQYIQGPVVVSLRPQRPLAANNLKRKAAEEIDAVITALNIKPELIFRSEKLGTEHFTEDTLSSNQIFDTYGKHPDFIGDIRKKLEATRLITTEQQV